MGEVKRRHSRIGRILANDGEGRIKDVPTEVYADLAAYLLEGSIDRTLLFGWRPSDGTVARQRCFMVVGGDRTGEMRCDQLAAETEADTVALRADVLAALVAHPPCVLHD